MRNSTNQSGFSLIELMVSLVAGMIVVGAVLAFALSSIRSNSEYVRSTRLTQELRTSLETAAEDLRRAGYDQDSLNYVARPPSFTGASPFSRIFLNAANNCVIYAYDRADADDADAGVLNFENGEVRGLRLATRFVNGRNVGVLEAAESTSTAHPECTGSAPDYSTMPATCSGNGWCPISDPRVINITQFQVVNDRPVTGGVAGLIPAAGSAALPMQVRKLQLRLTGALIAEPGVARTISTDIRVRSDCVRSAAATNCVAVPDGRDWMTRMNTPCIDATASRRNQRGITTLAITLILLGIVTIIVLFATNVAFFEQRTSTHENRAVATEQMAEYGLSLGGQFLNANRAVVVKTVNNGWLTGGASRRWVPCPAGAISDTHPCAAERNPVRRASLYYYDNDPSTPSVDSIPYPAMMTAAIGGILTGGDATSRFTGTTTLNALLCRVGYAATAPTIPRCELNPTSAGNVAVTLIATAQVPGESSSATVKETWATAMTMNPSAPVPLIASGLVEGLGNAQIVAAPNAGGYGVPAAIWSPNDIDIGSSSGSACGSGGLGSVSTCHLGEYLQATPRDQLKTTCATANNACGCPSVSASGEDFLSGHSGGVRKENLDILDRDGNCGALPDITFFPRQPYDDSSDPTDDSLFEYIFDVDYVVAEGGSTVLANCGDTGAQNCAAYALLNDYNAQQLSDCSTLNTSSSGIYYVTGDCDLNSIGSPTAGVILVVDGEVSINGNVDFYGMLFARSNNNTARVRGNGNVKIFGSLVVEGNVNVTGSIDIVYDPTAATGNAGGAIPDSVRFGRVTGSWLDSQTGF